MAIQGFPAVNFTITGKKQITPANLFKSVLFLLEGQDGYISAVTETKTGTGTVTPDGDVYADLDVIIEIVLGGDPGTATFKYSIDNGVTYSSTITTVAGSAMSLDNYVTGESTGLEVTFGGTGNIAGDKFEFFVKAGFRKNVITKLTANDFDTLVTHKQSQEYLNAFFNADLEASECYMIAPPNDTAGSITDTTGTVSGDGSIVVDGDPNQTAELKIEFIESGDIGTATYLWYIDDVQQNNTPLTLAEVVYFDALNVTATFTDGTPTSSFVAGDVNTFDLVPTSASNILLSLTDSVATLTPTILNNVKNSNLFTHIVIPTSITADDQTRLSYLIDQREAVNNFTQFVMQAEERGTLSVSAYETALLNKILYFKDYRGAITLDYLNTGTALNPIWTPSSVLFAQRIANLEVNVDPGKRSLGAMDVLARKDEENLQLIELALNNAGYIVTRYTPNSNGTFGYFFENSHVLSESDSSFVNYIDVRAFYYALYITAWKLYNQLNNSIAATDGVLSALGETINGQVSDEIGDKVESYSFSVLSTAAEFISNGYIDCDLTVNGLNLIKRFDVNAQFVN